MSRSVVLPCVAALLVVTGVHIAQAESPASLLFEMLASEAATAPAALREAAAGLSVADIRALEAAGGVVTVRGSGGVTALMLAAAFNAEPEVVQTLVDAGADVAARDANGWSALMFAAAFNPNPAMVQVLLDAGAPERASGTTAVAPFLYVPGHHGVLDRVLESQRRGTLPVASTHGGETALLLAAAYTAHPDVPRALVAAGANVRRADADGNTPLLCAAWFNPSLAGASGATGSGSRGRRTRQPRAHRRARRRRPQPQSRGGAAVARLRRRVHHARRRGPHPIGGRRSQPQRRRGTAARGRGRRPARARRPWPDAADGSGGEQPQPRGGSCAPERRRRRLGA